MAPMAAVSPSMGCISEIRSRYAGNHGAWGVGVDSEESGDAPNVLTSALKKTDVGVYNVILKAFNHKWVAHGNLKLNLTNNGVGIGKIDSSVPKAWITLMNQYKNQIINGSLKPPAHCPNNQCGIG